MWCWSGGSVQLGVTRELGEVDVAVLYRGTDDIRSS